MITGGLLHLACALVLAATWPGDEVESLARKYANRRDVACSRAKGDAAAGRAWREAAEDTRAEAWKLVRKQRREEDVEAAWRFALELDAYAAAGDLADHARSYLAERAGGVHRAYADQLLANLALGQAPDAAAEDRILAGFDATYEGSVRERKELKVTAAEGALRRGDVGRAQDLYAAALALPGAVKHLGELETKRLESWYSWLRERLEMLPLFEQDWSDLGGEDLDGRAWKVSDYRGQVLLIDYWASW